MVIKLRKKGDKVEASSTESSKVFKKDFEETLRSIRKNIYRRPSSR